MKTGQGMRQPQLGGSNSQLASVPVLGRDVHGTRTVTIEGIGTAEWTLPEYRFVKRRLDAAHTEYERDEARKLAEVTHAVKVYFGEDSYLVTDADADKPLPGEDGTQMELGAKPLSDPAVDTVGAHHHDATGTELAAALAQEPKSGTARARVLDFIRSRGEQGATDEEVSLALGMRLYTAAPRRNELKAGGWVMDSGRTRDTTTGSAAVVWVLTPRAREEAA